MSEADYNTVRAAKIQDLPNLPAYMVIEWLKDQHQAVGEDVAKACYQEIARSH